MADEQDVPPGRDQPLGLAVDLGDQRAGGVEIGESARGRFRRHRLGHAVRREHDRHAVGHLVQAFHEHRALRLERIDDIAIVDDLVPDIDRRAVFLDRQLDDANGAIDARAETARRGDQEIEGGLVAHQRRSTPLLASAKAASYDDAARFQGTPVQISKPLLAAAIVLFALAGCARTGEIDPTGGVTAVRSACPGVAIPAQTGDITVFDPPNSRDARAIDVVGAITNLRSTCNETGAQIVTTATFDVIATRRDPAGARQVVLPYFSTVLRGGRAVVSKRVGRVAINFTDGQSRATASGSATSSVDRAAATLPEDIRNRITRRRKAGDPDAAIDPLSIPEVRDAVARASFEHLIGFQLTADQLQYNATR